MFTFFVTTVYDNNAGRMGHGYSNSVATSVCSFATREEACAAADILEEDARCHQWIQNFICPLNFRR